MHQVWRAYNSKNNSPDSDEDNDDDGRSLVGFASSEPFLVKLWMCSKAKYTGLLQEDEAARQVQCPTVAELKALFGRTELFMMVADRMSLSSRGIPPFDMNIKIATTRIVKIDAVLPGDKGTRSVSMWRCAYLMQRVNPILKSRG